jgi:NADPH:quinone reductase-like Zn-dependent oxidoreductase
MRAIAVRELGDTPTLTDLPERDPAPGELLVRVSASSVNGFDVAVLAGWVQQYMEYRFPIVPGKDFAGRVEVVGADVDGFTAGDEVFGVSLPAFVGSDGAFAEYVTVDARYGVTRTPGGLDRAVAGALGLAGSAALTALAALGLQSGQTLLVSGATGGVGAIALQYAVASGVRVLATARPGAEAEFVLGLGAERTLDYGEDVAPDVIEACRSLAPDGVDGVLHLAGDPRALVDLLAPGGCLASTLLFGSEQHPAAVSIVADAGREVLDRLAGDVVAGRVTVPITRRYPLAEAPRALADFSEGTVGKYAVDIA